MYPTPLPPHPHTPPFKYPTSDMNQQPPLTSYLASDHNAQPTPKVTRNHSCTLCFQRKIKCDGQRPCSTCVRSRVECITKTPTVPRRRQRTGVQVSRTELLARLRRCEGLLEKAGVGVNDGALVKDGAGVRGEDEKEDKLLVDGDGDNESYVGDSVSRLGSEPAVVVVAPPDVGKLIIDRGGQSRYIENDLWSELGDELRESGGTRQTSSEENEENEGNSPATSAIYARGDSILFGHPVLENLRSSHPQPVQMFMLWQKFLDNVYPLTKLCHAPTVQILILEASSNLDNISTSTEALMFAIYLCAVTSLRDEDCEKIMGVPRHPLIARFSNAAQQALINAEILKTADMMVLQALTLFLLAMREHYEPYTTWLLAGLAVRIGQRIGLHRDNAEVSVFEGEMRRRLWWQILILDFRSAQLSGTRIESFGPLFKIKRPLNVNDSDLSPSMKETPVEHPGITDMVFCSIRYEIGEFMRKYKSLNLFDGVEERGNALISLTEKDKAIDEFESSLEQKYLRYTDSSIPLHFLSAGLARGAVCQMRLLAHHPRQYQDRGASLSTGERDMLFAMSLKMVEFDNIGSTNSSIRGYLWHMNVFLPLDAFIYLLSELRTRIEGEEVENAWYQVTLAFENHPQMITDVSNSLYFALGNLALKAWEKRSTAVNYNQARYQADTPEFITRLRSYRRVKRAQATKSDIDVSMSGIPKQDNQTKTLSDGSEFVCLEMAAEFDPGFLATYTEMDASPMDWEYWQSLLEGNEWPMMNS